MSSILFLKRYTINNNHKYRFTCSSKSHISGSFLDAANQKLCWCLGIPPHASRTYPAPIPAPTSNTSLVDQWYSEFNLYETWDTLSLRTIFLGWLLLKTRLIYLTSIEANIYTLSVYFLRRIGMSDLGLRPPNRDPEIVFPWWRTSNELNVTCAPGLSTPSTMVLPHPCKQVEKETFEGIVMVFFYELVLLDVWGASSLWKVRVETFRQEAYASSTMDAPPTHSKQ